MDERPAERVEKGIGEEKCKITDQSELFSFVGNMNYVGAHRISKSCGTLDDILIHILDSTLLKGSPSAKKALWC